MEITIRDEFIKVYMDSRYHNYSGDVNLEFNNDNCYGIIGANGAGFTVKV